MGLRLALELRLSGLPTSANAIDGLGPFELLASEAVRLKDLGCIVQHGGYRIRAGRNYR